MLKKEYLVKEDDKGSPFADIDKGSDSPAITMEEPAKTEVDTPDLNDAQMAELLDDSHLKQLNSLSQGKIDEDEYEENVSKARESGTSEASDSEDGDTGEDELDPVFEDLVADTDEDEGDEDQDQDYEGEEDGEGEGEASFEEDTEQSAGKKNKDVPAQKLRNELSRVKKSRDSIQSKMDALEEENGQLKKKTDTLDELDTSKAIESDADVSKITGEFNVMLTDFNEIYHRMGDENSARIFRDIMALDRSSPDYSDEADGISDFIENVHYSYAGRGGQMFGEYLKMTKKLTELKAAKTLAADNIDSTLYGNKLNGWQSKKEHLDSLIEGVNTPPPEAEVDELHPYNMKHKLINGNKDMKRLYGQVEKDVREMLLENPPIKRNNFRTDESYKKALIDQAEGNIAKSEKMPATLVDGLFWGQVGPQLLQLYMKYKTAYGGTIDSNPKVSSGRGRPKKSKKSGGSEYSIPSASELDAQIKGMM